MLHMATRFCRDAICTPAKTQNSLPQIYRKLKSNEHFYLIFLLFLVFARVICWYTLSNARPSNCIGPYCAWISDRHILWWSHHYKHQLKLYHDSIHQRAIIFFFSTMCEMQIKFWHFGSYIIIVIIMILR